MQIYRFPIILILLFFCTLSSVIAARKITLSGTVIDKNNSPVPFANVIAAAIGKGTSTDNAGKYSLTIESEAPVAVTVTFTGYKTLTRTVNESGTFNFVMEEESTELGQVEVTNKREREESQMRLNPKLLERMPGTSLGGIETSIKTQPGVSSGSELSSQYNVRGGNYDENLIYINGFMVQRPMLVRSGQQEGLSFVNPDLTQSLNFSSGGFGAEYGDKMSSVLDISYKKPRETHGGVDANFLGANAHFGGCSKSGKLTHISGIRYRNTSLLLKSLEETGTYRPIFVDMQSYLTYQFTDKLEGSAFIYGSSNSYRFNPDVRESTFSENGQFYRMNIYFDGSEYDSYQTGMQAINLNYIFSSKLRGNIGYGHYSSNEKEQFDIDASYNLSQIQPDMGDNNKFNKDSLSDTGELIAAGNYLSHARNYMFIQTNSVISELTYTKDRFQLKTGAVLQADAIDNQQTEWLYIDSAGHSQPYSESSITLNNYKKNDIQLRSQEASAYTQGRYRFYALGSEISTTAGIRYAYTSVIDDQILAPRGRISIRPDWKRDIIFRISGGLYHQTPRFKEMVEPDGSLNKDISSQKSAQIVAGADYNLRIWGRPFKLTYEAYYKHFFSIIPYSVDNVRIQYYPSQEAKGYARGMDFKLNGEFVPGTESWMSVSLLDTKEDVKDDGLGYLRRPSDRRINMGLFFQDYFPGYDTYKMSITMYYGTAMPTIPPGRGRESLNTFTIPDYQRVDIAFTKQILPIKNKENKHRVKNLWAGIEIFNLLDKSNVISNLWITDIEGKQWPIPNYLTRRRINVTVSGRF